MSRRRRVGEIVTAVAVMPLLAMVLDVVAGPTVGPPLGTAAAALAPTDTSVPTIPNPDPSIPEPKDCATYTAVTYYYDYWLGGVVQRGHASSQGWVTCTPDFMFAEVTTHVGISPGGQHNAAERNCLGGSTCTTPVAEVSSGRIRSECAYATASAWSTGRTCRRRSRWCAGRRDAVEGRGGRAGHGGGPGRGVR
jgi:hypothetical protein